MRAVLTALALAVPGAALAQDAAPLAEQALREAGCSMTYAQAQAGAPALGLTGEDLIAGVRILIGRGVAQVQPGGDVVVLEPATCRPAAPAPSVRDALLARMRAQGCRLDEAQGAAVAGALGIDRGEVLAEGQRLAAEGLARLTGGGGVLELTAAACQG